MKNTKHGVGYTRDQKNVEKYIVRIGFSFLYNNSIIIL